MQPGLFFDTDDDDDSHDTDDDDSQAAADERNAPNVDAFLDQAHYKMGGNDAVTRPPKRTSDSMETADAEPATPSKRTRLDDSPTSASAKSRLSLT